MKKIKPADPLLEEVEEAQRRLEAEFDNDPAKLAAHYEELQKRYAHRLISRHVHARVADQAPTKPVSEANAA
ncbi:MAG TPA: hypothetical protein VF006_07580 [Longimicrobium sp.]